jgi:hypothetical protein
VEVLFVKEEVIWKCNYNTYKQTWNFGSQTITLP